MKIILENGIQLDPDAEMCQTMTQYARDKGLKNARVFLADDKGYQTYLLVIGETPVYETQIAEHMGAHIDMMALAMMK